MVTSYPMTKRGESLLKQELDFLKNVKRPKITAAIAEARAHGDLKENAEYHAAREDQGFCEARIKDIEIKLAGAQVIDLNSLNHSAQTVIFGVKVGLFNLATEEEVSYRLVGDDEADPKQGRVSIATPIGKGLIGKGEGDTAKIVTPNGVVEYEIISIDFTPEPEEQINYQ